MKQSRLASFFESCGNTASGFFISLLCQFGFLVWWKGLPMSWHDNLEFAVFMTVISVGRSFAWRRLMERLHVRVRLSAAMHAVIAERQRQRDSEGYDEAHDDRNAPGALAAAGAAYLLTRQSQASSDVPPDFWPWEREFWNPKDVRRNLVRGMALGLAELEKLDRVGRRQGQAS
jgi:hypothetical protein